jgi:hypothetical protein
MTEFLTLADADLDEIWHEEEMPQESVYSRVMTVGSMDDLYKRDAKMAGFGPSIEISEGGDVTYDEAISPVTRRYDIVKRGLGYKITDKLWMNDRYGEVRQFEGDLRRADDDDTETFFMGIFNNATGTSVSTGFDGLALVSTAHTRMDAGATQANRPTTLVALSIAALEDAVIAFTKFLDERGRPFRSIPQTLLTVPDLVLTVEEILGTVLRPKTADNTTNALRNLFDLTPVVSHYLTGTSYWSLTGDRADINALWRMRPVQDSEIDFDSDTIKRKNTKWMARGHGEWRSHYQGNT